MKITSSELFPKYSGSVAAQNGIHMNLHLRRILTLGEYSFDSLHWLLDEFLSTFTKLAHK